MKRGFMHVEMKGIDDVKQTGERITPQSLIS